jgi:peptidoglycan/LPS O-acetylase OafA/YrhL
LKKLDFLPSLAFKDQLRPESSRWMRIDGLRFVASFGIILAHSLHYVSPAGSQGDVTKITMNLALFVEMFFVISGLIIASLYADRLKTVEEFLYFMRRRVARLIPLHWLTLAVSLVFWWSAVYAGFGRQSAPDLTARCVVQTALLLNGFVDCGNGRALNAVSWSIGVEMALYLLFPLLVLASTRPQLLRVATIVALGAACYMSLWLDGGWSTLTPIARGFPCFLFGVMLFFERNLLRKMGSWTSTAAPISLFLTATAMFLEIHNMLILAGVLITVTFATSADLNGYSWSMGLDKLAPYGQISYSLYMWHTIFITVIMGSISATILQLDSAGSPFMLMACYLLIYFCSVASLIYFEVPARRFVSNLTLHGLMGGLARRADHAE